MEYYRYRGYQIEPRREWSNWCVSIHPTRSDLPILSKSTLQSLAPQKDEASADAKLRIDHILADCDGGPG
jgi:hypothetical protein